MTTQDNTNPEAVAPVDSSQKAVTNPATQTLFRFTSLRNPQLTETSEDNLGFIFRPDGITGYFDTTQKNPQVSKFRALELIAEYFPVQYEFETEKRLESKYQNLIALGKAISEQEDLLPDAVSNAKENMEDEDENQFLVKVWDHFIYNIVTQKDFYLKEKLGHILKALHYLKVIEMLPNEKLTKINGENLIQKAAGAVVVLPESLFNENVQEDQIDAFTVDKSHIDEDVIKASGENRLTTFQKNKINYQAKKDLEISTALLKKQKLENLKKEMEVLKAEYEQNYEAEYKGSYEKYRKEIEPQINDYEDKLEQIEAGFNEETTEEVKKQAYQDLGDLEIPSFEFRFKNEINFDELSNSLSLESMEQFVSLFSVKGTEDKAAQAQTRRAQRRPDEAELAANFESKALGTKDVNISSAQLNVKEDYYILQEDADTFSKALSKISNEISATYSKILIAAELPQRKYANVGGVLVPVAAPSSANEYYVYAYSEEGLFTESNYLNFVYNVGEGVNSVAVGSVSIFTDTGSFSEEFGDLPITNGQLKLTNLFSDKAFGNIISLKVDIWYDNGSQTVLELDSVSRNTVVSGILKANKGTSSDSFSPASFQPKYFGLKRLGIADYLKVEQSIHAYVPGEVSNIENVMASELRHKSISETTRTEDISDVTKFQEVEKVSDTTKTDRTEVQTEVAKEIDRQQSIEAHTRFSFNKGYSFEIGGSYANNTAQHDSTRQAVAKSQEITERAMERVVTKITEERIRKIMNEVTLQNVHEFDNRGKAASTGSPLPAPPQHITGVYRWVDKKMKNQIYNYGKRTMFEFMIPEPARLHALATNAVKAQLTEPIDPRKAPSPNTMVNADVDEQILKYWADQYSIKLTDLPEKVKMHNIGRQDLKLEGSGDTRTLGLDIPENYTAKSARIIFGHNRQNHGTFGNKPQTLYYSNFNEGMAQHESKSTYFTTGDTGFFSIDRSGHYDYAYRGDNVNGCFFAFSFNCELSDTYLQSWRETNFNTIIAAYTAAKEKFDADVKAAAEAAAATEATNKEKATVFYRDTEANVLKHNCIAYLLQNQLGYGAVGQQLAFDDKTMQSFYMKFGDDLDNYTSLAKFMEQAFEWSIMDYTFYPYYWANKAHWQDLYLTEETDPLFRSFLQAGMARVVVTIKPGFEDAVQFFLNTGKIWNGGQVPVIGDPLYLSIVDELRQPTGKAQGKYWITRVPTSLTILQAKSVGLEVTDALPIFPEKPEDVANCENPRELEYTSAFKPSAAVMQNTAGVGSTLD